MPLRRADLGPMGAMPKDIFNKTVWIEATIVYPGSSHSDLLIEGHSRPFQVPNELLRAAVREAPDGSC